LNTANRDDVEVFQLYGKLHDNFMQAGGIHESLWLNLYDSMSDIQIDVNSDQLHPGVESNDRFAEIFSKVLTDKLC
jgi:hypothetical protein